MTTQVLMHQKFEASYDSLDGSIRNRVLNFMVRLQRDPEAPGLDLKHPQGAPSYVRTARVTDNYRAVLVTSGSDGENEALSLVAVKAHDAAYDYANSLQLQVNPKTGAAELYQPIAVAAAVAEAPTVDSSGEMPYLPAGVRRRDLERFGVDPDLAAKLVTVVGEEAFLAIAEALPATQSNAVLDLACGKSADDVWRDYGIVDIGPIDVDDIQAAMQRPISRLNFTSAAGDSEDELRAVLEGDFAKWRVWLHPLQRKLATHDGWNGPFRITGGAGTGKTVTAIHRARHLANRLDAEGGSDKVLLTTYTRNLVRAIESQLVELAGPDITKRVDIQNVDSLARAIVETTDSGRSLVSGSTLVQDDDRRLQELWKTSAATTQGGWGPGFLADEWALVVLGNSIEDEKGYLMVARSGRSQRLSRPQRADVWRAIEHFQRLMRAEGVLTFTELAARAASALAADAKLRNRFEFRHAIVDEAQDLHPAHWKMLRALVPAGPDDLFIVGDAHQRIYGRPTPLSRYGIETRGRSRRLTINYRTSREILNWTVRIADPDVDDLDTLAGARSVFGGPEPEALGLDTSDDEDRGIAEIIERWVAEGFHRSDIAVFTYEKRNVEQIASAFDAAAITNAVVGSDTREEKLGDAVRVMTMHRAKGLEYRGVILARLGEKDFPPWFVARLSGDELTREMKRLRRVLYVAGSRARERMAIVHTGSISSVLEPVGRTQAEPN